MRCRCGLGKDEWTEIWDWAKEVWGPVRSYDFNHFFRQVASNVAEQRGYEEVGSSDVWHISYDAVKHAQQHGVKTRKALIKAVLDYHGIYDDSLLMYASGTLGCACR
jgi:hypothetical protein